MVVVLGEGRFPSGGPRSRLYEAVISSAIKPSNPICMWLDYFTVTAFIFPSLTQLPYKSTGIHSIHPVANNSFPGAVSHTANRTVLDNITCSSALWHYGALSALCAQQIYVPSGNCLTLLFRAAIVHSFRSSNKWSSQRLGLSNEMTSWLRKLTLHLAKFCEQKKVTILRRWPPSLSNVWFHRK